MPRIARAVASGLPHHIVQRGNNRETVFFNEKDRDKYISLLKKYAQKWKAPILCYCLMSNHVHLLTRPAEEESLYKMMQGLTLCYTQYINRVYERTGRLWESRYYSCIVDEERYLWAVARYIEQNPVRANMVMKAEDYRYSSARSHVLGIEDPVLGEELFEEAQREDYRELLSAAIQEKEIHRIRHAARTGRPFGSDEFITRIENKLKRSFTLKSPGRPRKR